MAVKSRLPVGCVADRRAVYRRLYGPGTSRTGVRRHREQFACYRL